ncbi:MAG: cysteine desulfurase family protein [Phycisphaerales bacterium]|nr:cysteine desulfurase family protein [Phycisphaerales bacterium]
MENHIYFDYAATTPLEPTVLSAMMPYFKERFGNPSSIHSFGRNARAALDKARAELATLLNTSSSEIFFNSGGTEAINTVFKIAIRSLGVKRIISAPIEHPATLQSINYWVNQQHVVVDFLPVNAQGLVVLDNLEAMIQDDSKKTMVVLMHINNETGLINDIETIATLCQKYKVIFFSDTVQSIAHYNFGQLRHKPDFYVGSAHKFYGPKGSGLMYVNKNLLLEKGIRLQPLLYGGGQERNMRSGTENLPGIIGLVKALTFVYENLEQYEKHLFSCKSYFIKELRKIVSNDTVIFGEQTPQYANSNIISLALPFNERTAMLLYSFDIERIACSSGSACSSGANKGSAMMKIIYPEKEVVLLRISIGIHTTLDEINQFMIAFKNILL